MDGGTATIIAALISGAFGLGAAYLAYSKDQKKPDRKRTISKTKQETADTHRLADRAAVIGVFCFAGFLLVAAFVSMGESFWVYMSLMFAAISVGVFGHYLNDRLFPRQ
jgi:hypothetical protein